MMPPQYLQLIAEERQRELQMLAAPFVIPAELRAIRFRLADSLIQLGHALAVPEAPAPSRKTPAAGISSP